MKARWLGCLSMLAATFPSLRASAGDAKCFPTCRSGFACSPQGQCVSACNPPCSAGTTCSDHGECVDPSPPTSAPTPLPTTSPAASNESPSHDKIVVELEGDAAGAVLMKLQGVGGFMGPILGGRGGVVAGSFSTSQPICTSPCGASTDRHGLYWISGPASVKNSTPFALPESDPARLRIRAGSSILWGGGVAALTLGILGVVTGGVLIPLAATMGDPGDRDQQRRLFTIGGSSLAGGLVLGVLGGLLVATNETNVWHGDHKLALGSSPLRF